MLASILDRMFDHQRLTQRDELLNVLEQSLTNSEVPETWAVHKSPPWMYVQSQLRQLPEQGWKIHISATVTSASEILAICLPILIHARASFKFIMNLRLLRLLNSPHAPRAASGKFLTIYPHDIEVFRRLISECSEATAGFKGPMILSDKPFQPGGLVYYRYGAFKPMVTYDADGAVVYSLRNPEGLLVTDTRSVSSRQLDWVVDPFESSRPPQQPARSQNPPSILLRGRYTVTHAIRHANKGGVYLATDQLTGNKVVIKEARPHVASDRFDRDATDRLTREAENLKILSNRGLAPKPIELFWESGHLFLALEWLSGKTLREYVIGYKRKNLSRLPRRTLLALWARVARLLQRCHANGLVIRDFSPNNVMIMPSGRLYLIDLEMASAAGDERPMGVGEGTPGYASPQQITEAPASFQDDYYSLGGVFFFLTTLHDPVFPNDEPNRRTLVERVKPYLEFYIREQGLPAELLLPIFSNLRPSPDERWSPEQVLRYLSEGKSSLVEDSLSRHTPFSERNAICNARESAAAILSQITSSFDFDSPSFPFLPTCLGESSHPCNFQHGTAGVGMSIIAHARATGENRNFDALQKLCQWTLRYLDRHPQAPPGLYFGTAGTSWFLLEAATLLEDRELREAAIGMAAKLTENTAQSDVTHGAAGIGMELLHFFHQTGDSQFLHKAVALADRLLSEFSTESETGALIWSRSRPATPAADPQEVFYGFAHGIAGIAYFYLCLYLTVQQEEFLSVARRSAATLLEATVSKGAFLYWPHGPARSTLWPHWCNGNSGVGTFLIRFAAATGDRSAYRAAMLGARAILRERWISGISQCHGLAGNGEYLIDLFRFTGERRFFQAALYLAELIDLHKIYRPAGVTFPDDTGFPTGSDFSTGPAGVASFLSRLSNDMPRLFMLDYLQPLRAIRKPLVSWSSQYVPAIGSLSD